MKISYNWLKEYIPDVAEADRLADIFNYHLCEVENLEKRSDGDVIFDLKILPNRAHDLLSHQGMARELASLLNIKYIDPTPKYKIPESGPTKLVKEIESPKCRRYMGRVIRNIKIGPSPEWVVRHLESIGQRSINNIVDATNILMYDCGQPAHVFDLSKVKDLKLKVRNANNGEKITLLGGEGKVLNDTMMVISDDEGNSLDIAGVKGGEYAELTKGTKDIILEIANFDPTSVRKTAQSLNILTDAKKRFENDLSPELGSYAMRELSALILEMCPEAIFEDVVDVYPVKQTERGLSFSADRISEILGIVVSKTEIEDILKRYNFEYKNTGGKFEIIVPPMRLDLTIEEDMAEEIGRIIGYDKIKPEIPNIDFKPEKNEIANKIALARNKLLNDGYSEVMTYAFRNKGEVEVLASASDKKFLRANLTDGLKESLKLNQLNAPLLGIGEIKIFEIGTVFLKDREEMHVAYGDKKEINEMNLGKFCVNASLQSSGKNSGADALRDIRQETHDALNFSRKASHFEAWSIFPFIVRDIAVWVPENVSDKDIEKIIKDNMGELVTQGPKLFDSFTKKGKTSYAFRLIFQSHEKTLKDEEVNKIMTKIGHKISENSNWQIR